MSEIITFLFLVFLKAYSKFLSRSPGEGNVNPLQYSCPENPMDTTERLHFHFSSINVLSEYSFPQNSCTHHHNSLLKTSVQFSSIQSLSCVRLFATPLTAARQASLSITNSRSSPKTMSIKSVMPSSHLILCHPLLFLLSIFPSIRVSSHQVAKVLEFQLQHQSFQ